MDFSLPFHDLDQRIERGGVFRQSLANVKGEESERATGMLDQGTAGDHSFLVGDKIMQVQRLSLGHLSFSQLCCGVHFFTLPFFIF
jgi:hypothetical protein